VDAVTSQAGVCLGSPFPVANTAKTAGEPRITAARLPDTNTYSGIQSATPDPMWPLTGFAIGTVAEVQRLVDAGREFKKAVAEVFAANAQLLALWRQQKGR